MFDDHHSTTHLWPVQVLPIGVDRVSPIHRSRRVIQAPLDTRTLTDYIEAEVSPRGMFTLSSQSPSEDFQARIR